MDPNLNIQGEYAILATWSEDKKIKVWVFTIIQFTNEIGEYKIHIHVLLMIYSRNGWLTVRRILPYSSPDKVISLKSTVLLTK